MATHNDSKNNVHQKEPFFLRKRMRRIYQLIAFFHLNHRILFFAIRILLLYHSHSFPTPSEGTVDPISLNNIQTKSVIYRIRLAMFSKITRHRYYNANINMSQKDTLHKTAQKNLLCFPKLRLQRRSLFISI